MTGPFISHCFKNLFDAKTCYYRTIKPRPETSTDIKRRALDLFPELIPPPLRLESRKPVPEDLDSIVLSEVVGFRPARKTGLRLGRGNDLIIGPPQDQRKIPILHNIGHSGAGWQCCWGCAEEIVKLAKELIT